MKDKQIYGASGSRKKYKRRIFYFILIIIIGSLLFVYAEIDDSPGGQMLGLLAVVGSLFGIRRAVRHLKS